MDEVRDEERRGKRMSARNLRCTGKQVTNRYTEKKKKIENIEGERVDERD